MLARAGMKEGLKRCPGRGVAGKPPSRLPRCPGPLNHWAAEGGVDVDEIDVGHAVHGVQTAAADYPYRRPLGPLRFHDYPDSSPVPFAAASRTAIIRFSG